MHASTSLKPILHTPNSPTTCAESSQPRPSMHNMLCHHPKQDQYLAFMDGHYLAEHNQASQPFSWTRPADTILDQLATITV